MSIVYYDFGDIELTKIYVKTMKFFKNQKLLASRTQKEII
jgi:hypothetical protein